MFADDSVFYIRDTNFLNTFSRLQNFIDRLSEWLNFNKLTPNVFKTKAMIFNARSMNTFPQTFFNNVEIEYVSNFKYLGLLIDNRLSFKPHIDVICKKLSQVKGVI